MTVLIGQYDDSSGAPWLKGTGTAASLLAHAAVVLPFVIHFASSQPITSPAAVMVDYSPEFEVSKVAPELPPGINQQRKVEAMSEEEKPKQQAEIKVNEAEEAELKVSAQKPLPKTEKKPDTRKKARQQQREEKGNSTITSRAAPPVQTVVTQRTAAPIDTDATLNSSKVNWESLVKGKINRMRNYPEDARRRKRTGTVMITFSVNNRGEILTSNLVNSSGTRSLDKAALEALQKAQPLPAPPNEILYNGVHKVTLPVEFDLLRI